MNEGVVLFDEDARLLYLNPKHRELFPSLTGLLKPGVKRSTLLEAQIKRLDFADARGREDSWITEQLARHRSPTDTIEQEFADGRWFLLSETKADWGGVLGLRLDITCYKALESQLHQMRRLKALGKLTGSMAHDFNNLLAVILGNLELTYSELPEGHTARPFLAKAQRATERGAATLDRLQSFASQKVLHPRTVCIPPLLEEIMALLSPEADEQVTIALDLVERPLFARLDPVAFETAILDILVNAREAIPSAGEITLRASTKQLRRGDLEEDGPSVGGAFVEIEISDTGRGMDESVRSRIFEPFFTTKGFGQGNGLGLSMVYGFMRQSDGYVTVESSLGRGTTVKLYLPKQDAPEAPTSRRVEPPRVQAGRGETILVVEDHAELRETVVEGLIRYGFRAVGAPDGPSALRELAAASGKIDLVFSDIAMPNGMTGLDLADHVRREYRNLPVVLTSGFPERLSDATSLDLKDITLISKPYSLEALARSLQTALTTEPS